MSVSAGCMVKVEDSTIEHPNGMAISMSGGTLTLSGTTVKNSCEEEASSCMNVSGGTLFVTNKSKISAESYGNAISLSDGTLNVSDSIIEANNAFALYLGWEDNPVANITDSTVTSGSDAICVVSAKLNLKNTTVTTTGTGDCGISVSGTSAAPAVVTMDGGEVKAQTSSYPAVKVYSSENAYDECKFILTGGGRITGNSSGLEMNGGTFVMLGGEIETTSSGADAVELSNCVFAMTDSYDGKTATGANSVDKIKCSDSDWVSICILMGGNSHADVVDVNSCGVIFAQVSDISGDASVFTTLRNVDSACKLITNSFTSDTLPTGFTIMAVPNADLFEFDPDNWLWYYQEEVGASIPFSL